MKSAWLTVRRRLARITPLRFVYHLLVQPHRTIEESIRRVRKDGVFHSEDELYMASLEPRPVWDEVLSHLSPKTLIDVGCGVGRTIDFFVDRGVEAFGIEASPVAIKHARNRHRIVQVDLRHGSYRHPRAPFDVVWCYEVAEHLHKSAADALVETLTTAGHCIVLSAAQPGQGGVGHLNEQPPSYWRAKIERRGFTLDMRMTAALHRLPVQWAENLQVFRRSVAE